jgi:glucose/arabinose dehydrogenase
VADTGRDCIRRIAPNGIVTPVAGGGSTATCPATGPAANLRLSGPTGLAVAPDGSLVVADTGNDCVRRITGATASPVAGGGGTSSCAATTSASGVSLAGPTGVAVAPDGSVVVADTGGDCVRRVQGATVTRVAGGGGTSSCTATTTSTQVSLAAPTGVAVQADGAVVVADRDRRCVRRVAGGGVEPLAFTGQNGTSGDDGPALAAKARTPATVTVLADGDVLVADEATANGGSVVRRVELG